MTAPLRAGEIRWKPFTGSNVRPLGAFDAGNELALAQVALQHLHELTRKHEQLREQHHRLLDQHRHLHEQTMRRALGDAA